MANSYTEVTLTQAQTTGFTTPSYVEAGHLVVKVNDVVVPSTSVGATNKVFGNFTSTNALYYIIIEGQTSLSFSEELPSGAKIHIQRSSSQNSRLVDYSDASLLTADTMDRDANQIFFVAQEALDQSSLTNVAASDFYYSQGTEPATNTVGTLWYDTSASPNVLKIRSSTGWEMASPIMTQVTLDGSALAAGTSTYSGYDIIPVGSNFNDKSAIYLNGIKQVAGTSLGNNDYFQVGTNVYIPTVANTDVIQVISHAQNLDDVVTRSGTQTITGAKTFTGTINADGLTLGDSEYIKIGEGNNAGIPDLQIFSGGGNAFIEQPSGSGNNNLIIRGQNINLRNDADATLISTDNDQVRMWTQVAGAEDSTNGAAKFSTTTTGIDVNGTITTKGLTLDTGVGSSEATLQSSTGAAKLHINTTASGGTRFASIELGGTDGAFIDLKEPNSDDYDFRIEHGIGSDNVSFVSSKHPLVLQTLATNTGGTGGDVKIKREGVEKLATSATGIDVTGTVTTDALDLSGNTAGSNTNPVEVLSLPTNSKIEFDNTFSIEHRTYSDPYAYIRETGSGGLRLEGASLTAFTNDGTSDGIPFDKLRVHTSAGSTGNVKLYYGNEANFANHKFETTSTGVNVVGTVTADALDIDGDAVFTSSNTSDQVTIENTSTSTLSAPDLKFKRTGAVGQTSNIGVIGFDALNSTPANFAYANIVADATNITAGSETGTIKLQVHDPADGNNYPVPRLSVDKDGIDVTGTVTADGIQLDGNMETDGNITVQNGHELRFEATDGTESFSINTDNNNITTLHEKASGNLNIKGDALVLKGGTNIDYDKIVIHDEGGVKILSDVTGQSDSFNRIKVGNQHTGTRFYCGTDESTVRAEVVSAGLNVNGTVTADSITSAPTTVVTTNNTVPTVAVNKKYIDTYDSGVNAYVLPTGTVGQMITFVNASTQNITLNRNTNSITLEKVIAGSDPANVTANTITVGKSGAVEVVYTGTNTAVIFGSGIS